MTRKDRQNGIALPRLEGIVRRWPAVVRQIAVQRSGLAAMSAWRLADRTSRLQ